jgi:hypothetical protein
MDVGGDFFTSGLSIAIHSLRPTVQLMGLSVTCSPQLETFFSIHHIYHLLFATAEHLPGVWAAREDVDHYSNERTSVTTYRQGNLLASPSVDVSRQD